MERGEFVGRYLDRLGLGTPAGPDASVLCALHQAHLTKVPFENLDVHLGVPITLDPGALADKVLGRNRGGFCYELNGLFAELLTALGFRVTLLGARVWGEHGFGPPLDHLVLRVGCADDPAEWLADVGFGAHSLFPLRVEPQLRQDDPGGVFRIEPAGNGDPIRDRHRGRLVDGRRARRAQRPRAPARQDGNRLGHRPCGAVPGF